MPNLEGDNVDHRTTSMTMSYRDLGEGTSDPLVLLHAFPLNGKMFEPQMAAFSGDRRVVAPDLPGFGRSPRTPAQPDVRYYAEGVRSLLDRLGLERVVLGAVAALGAMRERPDSTPLLAEIGVSTLVIGGDEDSISSPEVMARMAGKIPDSRHVSLPHAGHLSNLETPKEFNAALKGFLEGIR